MKNQEFNQQFFLFRRSKKKNALQIIQEIQFLIFKV